MELYRLIHQLEEGELFEDCSLDNWRSSSLQSVLRDKSQYLLLENGTYVVVRSKPVPWLYQRNKYNYDVKTHITRVQFDDTVN